MAAIKSAAMQHWNGNQLCVIDTETTGLDPEAHEIIQICILPLDANIIPRRDVMPFYIDIIPEMPHNATEEALKKNGLKLAEIALRGHDRFSAIDMLEDWIKKLGLPVTKYGNPMKIIPLGHNYDFDKSFIVKWLGHDFYQEHFHYQYRDLQRAVAFINDRAAMHAERVPFNKENLAWVAEILKVPHVRKHDALSDCVVTAECYRKLISQGLFI